jgi:CelD/BcsL family acetyltransferase involved in cellulose biosynthesis
LEIRTYQSLEELEGLRPAWEELLAQIPTASIFNTWEWLAPWWRAFGANRRLRVLALHDDSGKLVGLAPLSFWNQSAGLGLRLRSLELMGDGSGDSDNLDVLVLPGCEADCARELLNHLSGSSREWDVCRWNTVPGSSVVAREIARQLEERKWFLWIYEKPWSVLSLPETWEDFLKQVSSKERDNIRYYLRRLEKRHQTRFYRCESRGELEPCLEALYALHQKRWQERGEPGSFGTAERRAYYYDLARTLLDRGWLEFWLLDLDGKPAAAQFSFRFRDTVYALQQGFDTAYSQLCVQDVLRAYVLRQLIERGVKQYDFLAGRTRRKERWATTAQRYLFLNFARPRTLGSLYLRTLRDAGRTKKWLRGRLPAPAWNVLHRLNVRLRGSRPGATAPSQDAVGVGDGRVEGGS